jgi:hypothetical protein
MKKVEIITQIVVFDSIEELPKTSKLLMDKAIEAKKLRMLLILNSKLVQPYC